MEKPEVTIYTDGGSDPNPGPGGWAALLMTRRADGSSIEALRALNRPCAVTLHTDSEYLKNGITRWMDTWIKNGWRTSKKEPVKNQDLWQALYAETQRHSINWQWVKGHAGNPYNERVDRLVGLARDRLNE
jgi:ribonuclease HI